MDNKVNAGGNIYLQLFTTFFKIGAFTFGGGWAMLSLIEKEIVDKRGWIDRTEYLDLIAVSQSLPGILAVNVSVAVGDKLRGMKGAVTASLGTILPSFMIILCIAIFLTPDLIKENETLLIWSKLPIVSSPILYILLGGIGGWWWLSRHQRKLRELEDEMRKEEEEKL